MKKLVYYDIGSILRLMIKTKSNYGWIIGERSFGKTFQYKKLGLNGYEDKKAIDGVKLSLKGFIQDGSELAIIRRWDTDFVGETGKTFFDDFVNGKDENGKAINRIYEWTNGEWDRVSYYGRAWYLAKWDDDLNKVIRCDRPFARAFALSIMEHYKSSQYPNLRYIVYEECVSSKPNGYLVDEFSILMNMISTLVRDRDDVMIFLVGNSISAYCPLYEEFGIGEIIRSLKTNEMKVVDYGESELHLVVEHTDSAQSSGGKASDKLFAFNNPKLRMITHGEFALEIYPHNPYRYKSTDVRFRYFIKYLNEIYQADVVRMNGGLSFTFIHKKTGDIKNDDTDLVYSLDYNAKRNYRRRFDRPVSKKEKIITKHFYLDKVYYQDNMVGEAINSYIRDSKK